VTAAILFHLKPAEYFCGRKLSVTDGSQEGRHRILSIGHLGMSEFWSGDLGLTLVTICLVVLIFIIFPLQGAGLPERILLYFLIVALMVFGAVSAKQSRMATTVIVAAFVINAAVLVAGRLHPTPLLHQTGSVLTSVTLILYTRIVLLVMFRSGQITWSRIQGGVCAYLLIGLAWSSVFEFLEDVRPGSFHFLTAPKNIDELTSKLTYFSFSTLTTVGFGDVTPIMPFARSLSIAEAIVGQLFPAILIGALVAMAMQARSKL
jgi:hypothetical protein